MTDDERQDQFYRTDRPGKEPTYQQQVDGFMLECFGRETTGNILERVHRFLEEALELAQALGCTPWEAWQLVAYVFMRPRGQVRQEVGGVRVTLAALCNATSIDCDKAGEIELARCRTSIEKIRKKQAEKPKASPLPAPFGAPRAPWVWWEAGADGGYRVGPKDKGGVAWVFTLEEARSICAAIRLAESPVFLPVAIGLLNSVKAWRDSDGNEPFPVDLQMGIDALLGAHEIREREKSAGR